jgi:hypothetical protein
MIAAMPKRRPGRGRPSKGDRDLMATRLLAPTAALVRELAEARDWTYSDTLAALVTIGLHHRDELPAETAEQEELPLTKAS